MTNGGYGPLAQLSVVRMFKHAPKYRLSGELQLRQGSFKLRVDEASIERAPLCADHLLCLLSGKNGHVVDHSCNRD